MVGKIDILRGLVVTGITVVGILSMVIGFARAADDAITTAPASQPHKPTLYLIGDSTVRNGQDDGQHQGAAGQWGWGHILPAYFDPAKIIVENDALGGTSSRDFRTKNHWAPVLKKVQPGDFVMMQFGHNDGGSMIDPVERIRARTSLKGNGDDTTEMNLSTGKETVHSYGWYMRQYIEDVKTKGGIPIVCSLIPRNGFKDGKAPRSENNGYALWVKQAADQEKVAFIQLNGRICDEWDKLGADAVMKIFPPNEHTHPNWAGATLNVQCVVAGIKDLKDCPLKDYLAATPAAIEPPATRPAR